MNFSSLHNLLAYFSSRRRVGHTTAMLEGVKNSDCIVLVSSENIANSLKKLYPNTKFITEGTLENNGLDGYNKPLLIDHTVLIDILHTKQLQENEVPDQAIKIQKEKVTQLGKELINTENEKIKLQKIITEIVPALAQSVQALNDLSNDYDGIDGDPEQVKESRARIYKQGVKKYIAEIQKNNTDVLTQYNQYEMNNTPKYNMIINARRSGKTVTMKSFTDWQTKRLQDVYPDQSI